MSVGGTKRMTQSGCWTSVQLESQRGRLQNRTKVQFAPGPQVPADVPALRAGSSSQSEGMGKISRHRFARSLSELDSREEKRMYRRTLISALAVGAILPMFNRVARGQTSPKTKNVVFVHGLFADGSCWSKVIARLQQKGVNCTSVQNPLTSLHEASEAAGRAIAAQSGPTVLVGHSFSGMIVTDVGLDPKVTALVYVAARAPDAGEDYTALAKTYPTPPATAGIVFYDDWGQLSEEAFLRDFAGDLSPEEARTLYAVQQPFKLTAEKATHAAWRTKPTFYAVSTQDRTINPELQRFMAKRMGAKTIEIEASHLALISHPDAITNLILEALAV